MGLFDCLCKSRPKIEKLRVRRFDHTVNQIAKIEILPAGLPRFDHTVNQITRIDPKERSRLIEEGKSRQYSQMKKIEDAPER